ncbi:EAL domain-containing protein [Paenibacillus sp. YPG26]|uniref:EAL domain-containing protein n=1 Tax=Paenibacillus sp. YPG26 TaxID=2878915 RepID=UPI0020409B68|nr:EAL domain-containing protein [Paenibacillus sp. YPG26]USB33005.1 EAL domain-containing protein [Paenibacillus sp. YPG26]
MTILTYSIIADLIPFLFLFYMAVEVFLRQRSNPLHQLTMILTFSLGLIFLFDFLTIHSTVGDEADLYASLRFIASFLTMSLSLYFFCEIGRLGSRVVVRHTLCLLPMLGVFFVLIPMYGKPAIHMVQTAHGRITEFSGTFVLVLVALILYTLLVLPIIILIAHRKNRKNKLLIQERYRVRVILTGSTMTVALLIILMVISQLLKNADLYVFDSLSTYCVFPWIIAVRYSMVRFDFLATAGRRYELLYEMSHNGIALLDEKGVIVEMNQAFQSLLGFAPNKLKGRPFHTLLSESGAEQFVSLYPEYFENLKPFHTEGELKHLDGTLKFVEIHCDFLETNGKVLSFLVTQDITEQRNTQRELTELAYNDTLTGLGNRRLLQDRIKAALEDIHSSGGKIAIILIDLDQFKWINDTLGHSSGDLMLQQVASNLKRHLPRNCVITRLGGDEFAIMIADLKEEFEAVIHCNTLIEVFKEPFAVADKLYNVTASMGISIAPRDGTAIDTLLQNADMAMYEAKRAGRNQLYMFNKDLQEKADRYLAVYNGLSKAIAQNELTLHYQPQIDLQTRRVHGVEALLRWTSPELGPVSPAEFIPVAEDTGLILTIGDWVLQAAVHQAKYWVNRGYKHFVVSVNISAQQLRDPHLAVKIIELLRVEGLPARNLCLEITESTAIVDLETSQRLCKELTSLGITLALDDFGVGYSSLSMLNNLPLHYLKIDRSLVTNIAVSQRDSSVVGTIIELSRNLDMKVVAEGIETDEQLRLLEQLGCHEAQGYLCGRPMPADDLTRFLEGK